jgi:hypothetical protein
MTYDPRNAQLYNTLIQSGLSTDAAFAQSGISATETGNYALGNNDQLGAVVAGAANLAGTSLSIPNVANLESVPFALNALANPSQILSQIPSLPSLPSLPTLPSVTNLIADLPGLPSLPALPALPSLSDLPTIPTNLANIATGFPAGFTDALPPLPSVTGALQLTAAQVAGLAQQAESAAGAVLAGIRRLPAAIPDNLTGFVSSTVDSLVQASGLGAVGDLLTKQNATIRKAKEQATLQARNNEAATPDWRVRLSLAPGAKYLYKNPSGAGILAPLFETDGVIFPYTPSIETAYGANYDKYDLIHSNYRGYFYKNSTVNDINIRGTFTAQDTTEADYLLAVIHFFRSATRMFYGQDSLRGAPPPLVYLTGLGAYQFNKHPCLLSNFSYSLPDNVDYIRAGAPNNYGNLFSQRAKTGGISTSALSAVTGRLIRANLPPAAEPKAPSPSPINQNVNNLTGATYVPTKIEINITLLPTNTRSQVSQQFSVDEFANGNLLKGGFW